MPEQKALAIAGPNAPYTLIKRPIPIPGSGDVLVRVGAAGLNPAEWKVRTFPADVVATVLGGFPALAGTDGAGTVVEVGANVKDVKIGDRVLFQGWFRPDRSTHQEFTLVYGDLLAKIPSTVSFTEAASIPLALATAVFGLALSPKGVPSDPGTEFPMLSQRGGAGLKALWEDDAEGFYAGKPAFVVGGASACGYFAIQILKYLGFSPIITTASLHNAAALKLVGATHVLDRHASDVDLATQIQGILGGSELKIVYDAVLTPVTQDSIGVRALTPGGILVSIWEVPEGLAEEVRKDSGKEIVACHGSVHMYKELGRKLYAKLGDFIARGVIKPMRVEKLEAGLAGIPGGLERLQRNEVSGVKLVVDPAETP